MFPFLPLHSQSLSSLSVLLVLIQLFRLTILFFAQIQAQVSHSQSLYLVLVTRNIVGDVLKRNLIFCVIGFKLFPQLDIKVCGKEGEDCVHALGVLPVSLGCYIFFSVMLVTTVKTRKLHEHQSLWHSGRCEVKSIILLVSVALPFFFPSELVQIYGEVARIGAG